MDKKELQNPALYTNRELSWLLFNKRVLSEARDKQLLLFERLKFLSITASNLDEFFMVRIGSLVDMIHAEYTKKDIAGMSVSYTHLWQIRIWRNLQTRSIRFAINGIKIRRNQG